MSELGMNIGSSGWWLSVVLVGILINVVAAYLKNSVDSLLARFLSYRRNRNERAKEEYRKEIETLKKSKELQRQYEHHEIRTRLEALFGLVLSVMLLALKSVSNMYPELNVARLVGVPESVSGALFNLVLGIVVLVSVNVYFRAEAIEEKLATAQQNSGTKGS